MKKESAEILAEKKRIQEKDEHSKHWLKWGPYLSERQWGTVREDYSNNSDAWNYVTFDKSKSYTYRWGEDGIAGISDDFCNICFSIALWNGRDSILKERLFGMSNPQGNHGEDVKELYYYLDNTPTHSYMKYLYKYTQSPFPYEDLTEINAVRGLEHKEYELLDTDAFEDNNYFDVCVEYAKVDVEDILIKISATNHSKNVAPLHILPTLLMRNKWSFSEVEKKPKIKLVEENNTFFAQINYPQMGEYYLYFQEADRHLFTENETNNEVVFETENNHPFKKDLFHHAITENDFSLATAKKEGTKFSPVYRIELQGGETKEIKLRLTQKKLTQDFSIDFDEIMRQRHQECHDFYQEMIPEKETHLFNINKQALSGLLWTKQYYNYNIEQWLEGDKQLPKPPKERKHGRNAQWKHLRNEHILLMPDKWEYPWFAAWDSAFHVISMASIDLKFAKEQLMLFLKEWYMRPNGQIPAYEWNFSDVNPPVQPWATLMIYHIEKQKTGKGDVTFLKRMFNKLSLNFTWWVNRLDRTENNVFEGGFLGLDNIGIFDRSQGIPGDATLEQVDGTSWMALFCLSMLKISLEIAKEDSAYEDMATKYLSHFIHIAQSLNDINEDNIGIWDEEDGFFYDKLTFPDGRSQTVKVRSIVGMLSLIAVLHIPEKTLNALPRFRRSFEWFKQHRMHKLKYSVVQETPEQKGILLSLVPRNRIDSLIHALLDEEEFLSPFGVRSLSKRYTQPYLINLEGNDYKIQYTPAESDSPMFGGNSNWRGPIWFPINYIIIDSLRELHKFYGDSVCYDFPTGSQRSMNFKEISQQLSRRLIHIFSPDASGNRPVNKLHQEIYRQEDFKHLILFYEYFHADNGRGVGASHQTGWTALVANLIQELLT